MRRRLFLAGLIAAGVSGLAHAQNLGPQSAPSPNGAFGPAPAGNTARLGPVNAGSLPSLDLNFLTGVMDPRIKFTRADATPIASYFDVTGVMRFGPTNLLLQSGDLTNAAWTKNSTTVIAGGTAPNGLAASQVTFGAGPFTNVSQAATVPNNSGTYTASIFVKAGTAATFGVKAQLTGGTQVSTAPILNAATMVPTPSTNTTVTPMGGGWYRVACTVTNNTTGNTTLNLQVIQDNSVAGTVFVADGQTELGAVATNYATTGAAAGSGPRFDYSATTGTVTNQVRNSTMASTVAGTPGTVPVDWTGITIGPTGIATQIVGTGIESGLSYIDVRWFGTATGTGFPTVFFETTSGIPSTVGELGTSSYYTRLIAGTGIGSWSLGAREYSAGGALLVQGGNAAITPTTAALNTQRNTLSYTNTQPTTAFVQPFTAATITNGAVVDVTYRFAAPQRELGAVATTWVPTVGAASNLVWAPRGLLIEETRVNGVLWSGDLSHAPWAPANTGVIAPVVTGNNVVAPDGTTSGAKIVLPAVPAGSNASFVGIASGSASGVPTASSIWLRGNAGGEVVNLFISNFSVWIHTSVTLTTTWTRYSFAGSPPSTNGTFGVGADLRDATQTPIPAPETIFAWGADVEAGTFASSYIPTTTGTVTRAADIATMPLGPWYRSGPWSMVGDMMIESAVAANAPGVAEFNDGTSANRVFMGLTVTTLTGRINNIVAGVGQGVATSANTASALTPVRVGLAQTPTVGFVALGGGAAASVAWAAGLPPGLNLMQIGSLNVGNALNGWLPRLRYWPRAFSTYELQAATAAGGP